MRHTLLALTLILFSSFSSAQEEPAEGTTTRPLPPGERFHKQWVMTASTLIWNESMELQSGITTFQDVANYGIAAVTIRREFTAENWGFHLGGFFGAGGVNGGGNSPTIEYTEGNVPVTVIGATPRLFYNLSDRINLGASSLIFVKTVTWPTKAGVRVGAGRNMNAAFIFDINVKLFDNWEFNQGLGAVAEGNTLWNIGISRRF